MSARESSGLPSDVAKLSALASESFPGQDLSNREVRRVMHQVDSGAQQLLAHVHGGELDVHLRVLCGDGVRNSYQEINGKVAGLDGHRRGLVDDLAHVVEEIVD